MASLLEIEVKFYISDVGSMRENILSLGASASGRHFEKNICFENNEKTFKKQDMLLRLRQDSKARLTLKKPPEQKDEQFKTYRELEVEVGDFEGCLEILQSLGFHPDRRYEKWRETFVLNKTLLLLDTTPFGVFLEIEGLKPDIRHIADELGLPWHKRILLNYLAMFEIIRRGEGFSFNNMTFKDFESVHCDVARYLEHMIATSICQDVE